MEHGPAWTTACEELDLVGAVGSDLDTEEFLAARSTPVLFGAALPNIGVRHLLDVLVDLAPPPSARPDQTGRLRALHAPFSGQVFKVQANMDAAHRDRIAFVRVCSGRFDRGMVVTHGETGRPFATKYAQQVFGQQRNTIDTAYPGDVVGLVNASALRVGDTLYTETPVAYPAIPSFAPEHFAVAAPVDTSRHKQFRRGVEQLRQEGVGVEVLTRRGDDMLLALIRDRWKLQALTP